LPNRDAKVAALVPGRIKSLLVVEGTRVAADQPIAELDSTSLREQLRQAEAAVTQAKANLENARLSAQRNEELLQHGIAASKENEFEFQTYQVPEVQFKARVVAVLPAVDPVTNNGTVRIRIANPRRLLRFGMFVSVNLPLKENKERLVLPRQAVYPDESGEPHVYKIESNEAESVPVKLGIQTKDESEILSGVQEGDKVILVGGYGLPEKSKVRVKQ